MRVHAFKKPTDHELAHDFLWRIHGQVPTRGQFVIFNRSHYKDVGIVRVHGLVPKKVWTARFEQINAFERLLSESGTVVLKFFLSISRREQKRRLESRLRDPAQNWKMDLGDLEERKHWAGYMRAYSEALGRCGTDSAPWHVIPSDQKRFRNYAVAAVLERALSGLKLRYPKPGFDPGQVWVV
jgi:PPK2 family polyphosphate:nucleotide phosphotransferase